MKTAMAHETGAREPADATRVNINDEWELLYWCTNLVCTEAQLLAAVDVVGTSPERIAAYLKRR